MPFPPYFQKSKHRFSSRHRKIPPFFSLFRRQVPPPPPLSMLMTSFRQLLAKNLGKCPHFPSLAHENIEVFLSEIWESPYSLPLSLTSVTMKILPLFFSLLKAFLRQFSVSKMFKSFPPFPFEYIGTKCFFSPENLNLTGFRGKKLFSFSFLPFFPL